MLGFISGPWVSEMSYHRAIFMPLFAFYLGTGSHFSLNCPGRPWIHCEAHAGHKLTLYIRLAMNYWSTFLNLLCIWNCRLISIGPARFLHYLEQQGTYIPVKGILCLFFYWIKEIGVITYLIRLWSYVYTSKKCYVNILEMHIGIEMEMKHFVI